MAARPLPSPTSLPLPHALRPSLRSLAYGNTRRYFQEPLRKPAMAALTTATGCPPTGPSTSLDTFRAHLAASTRIMALCGAGLSASSGLPTFRGAGGLWRNYDATELATPHAFGSDPGLVWQFYGHRRHLALRAEPNHGHRALARLAEEKKEFVTLTQNVDGLSPRAGHPPEQLHLLHGSLFDVRCASRTCRYVDRDNFVDPLVPALEIPTGAAGSSSDAANTMGAALNIADVAVPLRREIPLAELPQCPQCRRALLRPGVVWFTEPLPQATLDAVADYTDRGPVDLMLVVGTSSAVYPAAGYVDIARSLGARVAVVNVERGSEFGGHGGLGERDWFFQGDAAELLPEMLRDVIGEV